VDQKLRGKPTIAAPLTPVDGGPLAFEIVPEKVVGPISPYVYGINSQSPEGIRTTVRRMGGNRQTAYNWENNASNAGNDWKHNSDDWPCTVLGYRNCNEPGAQMLDFAEENRRAGIESLVTIPMVDYVTADKKGPVQEQEAAPSPRFVKSQPRKPGALSLVPDLADGVVYQNELVNLLVQKLGKASQKGVRFYALDNEPALWPSTHPRVHPNPTTYEEIVRRTDATATAITEVDPSAIVFGAVAWGWNEFMSLGSAPDAEALNAKHGGTYLDYFLASMKRLEEERKRRIVHVLDVHWYPEVKGSQRITEDDASRKTITARLQAPRSLWDPSYRERSWVDDKWGKPIRLIPWLHELVAKHYPGTKLSLTEYNYGAGSHISGGLAQVDVLGVFGREGLFMANYWGSGPGNGDLPPYIVAAFKLYRNYDGKGAGFGDTAVGATVADLAKASVYAAVDSKNPKLLWVMVINKDLQGIFRGEFQIQGATQYARAGVYVLDGKSPQIRPEPPVDIRDNRLSYSLAPLSATLFVCERK
jgi:mannan endo-1,4-beta-mannosidase